MIITPSHMAFIHIMEGVKVRQVVFINGEGVGLCVNTVLKLPWLQEKVVQWRLESPEKKQSGHSEQDKERDKEQQLETEVLEQGDHMDKTMHIQKEKKTPIDSPNTQPKEPRTKRIEEKKHRRRHVAVGSSGQRRKGEQGGGLGSNSKQSASQNFYDNQSTTYL